MNGMKGVCSISRKKLIKGLIAVPIAVLALLYGSGYLSQLLYNYERWQAAGGVYGTAPDFPDPNFFLCLAAALHLPYGLYGLGICMGLLALLILMVMRMGYSDAGEMCIRDRERYVLLGVMVYTAPIAFAMGASQSTSNIFKSWCRMFGGQVFLLLMNAWCLRLFILSLIHISRKPVTRWSAASTNSPIP